MLPLLWLTPAFLSAMAQQCSRSGPAPRLLPAMCTLPVLCPGVAVSRRPLARWAMLPVVHVPPQPLRRVPRA